MQSTIFFLQQELKAAKDTITSLETEINRLKSSSSEKVTNGGSVLTNCSELLPDFSDSKNLISLNNKRTSKLNYMNGGTDLINSDDKVDNLEDDDDDDDDEEGNGKMVNNNDEDDGDGCMEVDDDINNDEDCSLSKLKINPATTDNLLVNTRKRRGSDSSDQSNNSCGNNIEMSRTKLVKNNLRKTRRSSNMLISELNDAAGGELLLKTDKVNDIRNDLMKGTLTISLTSASNGNNKKQIIKTNDID